VVWYQALVSRGWFRSRLGGGLVSIHTNELKDFIGFLCVSVLSRALRIERLELTQRHREQRDTEKNLPSLDNLLNWQLKSPAPQMPVSMDNVGPVTAVDESALNLHQRIFRSMLVVTLVATVVSVFVAQWRVSTGLLLGGVLALFSHHWLKSSAAAAINLSIGSTQPRLRLMQFVLRYIVIGLVVFLARQLGLVSVPAVIIGLSTFVVALFIEALREFYVAIIRREETS
jgi:ATP synthase I chain